MKYINNGISQNIIKDSDINLSESFQNLNLAEVLTQYKEDLNTLKSNVKWLAKYGGVGGNGGTGGSSNIKLKYKVDIQYINNANIESSSTFNSKTTANKLLIKDGSTATVTITLQRCLPNTKYAVQIMYGESKYTASVDSLSLSVSKKIKCTGNSTLTIIVYADPSDMPATDIQIYTVAKSASLKLTLGSSFIAPGGIILQDQLSENFLIGNLINYLPTDYEGTIKEILINNVSKEFTIEESVGQSGEYIKQFKIQAGDIFDIYGIFEIIMKYEYNGVLEFIKNTYIYKDNPVFLYCYGTNNVVYSEIKSNPSISNSNVEKIIGRIYPTLGSNKSSYRYEYTIAYEGKENIFKSLEFNIEPYQDFDILFENPYIKTDFIEKTYKQVTINFLVYDTEVYTYTYYVYISLVPEIDYFFKDSLDKLFYHAMHSSTATINEEGNKACTTFPFENGLFKKLTKEESHKITNLTTTTGLTELASSVYGTVDDQGILSGGYVSNYTSSSSAVNPDILLSFGLKYDALNLENPILKITVSPELEIILCGDRIKYGNNLEFTRWCIPQDNQYHLIQLYFKPYYSFEYLTILPTLGAFIWCVDGVFETAPIKCDRNYSFSCNLNNESKITYYPGNWDFNYIGVASFNAKPNPNTWNNQVDVINKNVIRYVLDFDPIIPANYYQAYYKFIHKVDYPKTFDKSIYPKLYGATSENEYSINFYKGLDKFIPFDIVTLSRLSDLPIYVISPDQKQTNTDRAPINLFLYDTFMGEFSEAANLESLKIPCTFKKAIVNGTEISYENMVGDAKYSFSITFLGSSTLKYSTKNFEISANPFQDPNDKERFYDVVWTPDESKFLPEKSFTLKADVVDSSHSNNVIIGKFVNNYMNESAMQEGAKTCLEGFPILLFMEDTLKNNNNVLNTIFLGIYSFNLGRKSEINLGYKNLDKDKCESISSENSTAKAYLIKDSSAIQHPNKYKVAEVQGGSPLLYDYSQYDQLLLKDMMFDDFFLWDGLKESDKFADYFQRPFKGLNKLIYLKFIVDLESNYKSTDFNNNDILVGYYEPNNSAGIFNVLKLNFEYSKSLKVTDSMYFKNSNNILTKVPDGGLVLNKTLIDTIQPYLTVGDNGLTVIGNPFYQFHLICNSDGISFTDPRMFYVEKLLTIPSFNKDSDDYFNYDNTLRYYMVCMLFAMVDSVLKNLTIRCRDFDANRGNEWLLGFYDMDTAFGVDNIGNPVDFKAFSDFITGDGKVIYDYYHEDSENKEGSGFDVPSHYLFLLAKYMNIITSEQEIDLPLGERTYTESNSEILRTPFNYWQTLRKNELKNLDEFFKIYIDEHFGELNPIIWNLDYLYKYFSKSNNTSLTDTELSKFNGTRRHSRKTWFLERVKILDALFGIRNNHKIGNSATAFIGAKTFNNNNPDFLEDVPISKTMFPNFTKGVTTSGIDVTIKTKPKTPVVMLTETSLYNLYIADKNGDIKNITATIPLSTDVGFFGTTEVFSVDECGLFLIDANANKVNSIKNNIIEKIIINKYPPVGTLAINLNLADLKSISSILVNKDIGKDYKGRSFTISNSDEERIIDTIEFNRCKFTSDLIIGGTKKITINKLVIKQCSGINLTLQNIKVLNWEFSSNTFTNYNFEGLFPKTITLTDNTAEICSFNLSNNQNKITLTTSNLTKLILKGSISSFINNKENHCKSITIEEITPEKVTLDLKNFIEFDENLTIQLLNATELTLSCNNNRKLKSLNFTAPKLETINLSSGAFYNNENLTKILIGGSNWISKTINIKGPNIFTYCKNLEVEYMIPSSSSDMHLAVTNVSLIYAATNITMSDIIKFFNYIKKDVGSINLSRAFVSCKNLNFKLTVNNEGVCTYPITYNLFITALTNFKNGNTVTLDYLFLNTSFNFLDNNLVKLFKNGNNLTESVRDTSDNILYISSDFLKEDNANITSLSLSNTITTLGTGYTGYGSIKFYEKDEDVYKIITTVKLKEILTNGNLKTIGVLNPHTNASISVDCTNGGFPETIKKINAFSKHKALNNYIKLEDIFNGLTSCDVNMYDFFRSTTIGMTTRVNIYNFLFTESLTELGDIVVTPKVNFKLSEKSTYSNKDNATIAKQNSDDFNLRFKKTCSEKEFKKIMEYFLQRLMSFLDGEVIDDCDLYNQLPGLFANCEITEVTSFKNLITSDIDSHSFFTRRYKRKLDGSFDYNTGINYIDLYRTFSECSLKDNSLEDIYFNCFDLWEETKNIVDEKEYIIKTPIISLCKTFVGTKQEKIMSPFYIKDVKTMEYCFFNCKYSIPDNPLALANPSKLTFAASWSWRKNFPLIPLNFFTGFNRCNITQCFASDKVDSFNLQGLLFTEGGWWDNDADVNVSTIPNLTLNALLHPILNYKLIDKVDENGLIVQDENGEVVQESVLDYYCLYPTAYTNKFASYTGVYNHVILPLNGDYSTNNPPLYIFEDSTTELILGKLPKLPAYGTSSDLWTLFFGTNTFIVKINKNNVFNNSPLMSTTDYKGILPNSLFLVLNAIRFKNTANISNWDSPILIKDYIVNYDNDYFIESQMTPGGIVPISDISSALLSKLKSQ